VEGQALLSFHREELQIEPLRRTVTKPQEIGLIILREDLRMFKKSSGY
jgi:hypothetical protein